MVFLEKLEQVQKDLLLFDTLASLEDFYGIDFNDAELYSEQTKKELKKAIKNGTEFRNRNIPLPYLEDMLYFLDTIGLIDNFKKI